MKSIKKLDKVYCKCLVFTDVDFFEFHIVYCGIGKGRNIGESMDG